jgi:aerobic-type carbon monoxide dehydrogenase small subunit (CoxS/CutS family)
MITLDVNGKRRNLDVPDDMPLLWTLRDVLGMTGTKFGCGAALCGACTIHIDGQPTRSCVTPVSANNSQVVDGPEGRRRVLHRHARAAHGPPDRTRSSTRRSWTRSSVATTCT